MEKEIVYQVQWTKDYKKFTKFSYNRPVDEKRVEKIKEVIKKNGFLVPILANKDYCIIDGQHRLSAVEKLGIQFSYMLYDIDNEKMPLVISQLNSTSKSWSIEDYYNMWLDLNIPAYVELNNIMKENTIGFSLLWMVLARNCYNSREGKISNKFKEGSFTLTQSQKERLITSIKNANELFNKEKKYQEFGRSFKKALLSLTSMSKYKHEYLTEALEKHSGLLLKCENATEYSIQIEEMYNRVAPKNERIKTRKSI